ncbi:hypothetical protein QYE76_062506 [Lolium multiflorum]|uniref:DUF4218 domain-containing protein n=1 Tax=Lolium multiflorum TaxID=4521 RepID=A0AAD8W5Q5_LOLMU|nr:hypothetical protein QYE76_062506 [Lolium multiflorum]
MGCIVGKRRRGRRPKREIACWKSSSTILQFSAIKAFLERSEPAKGTCCLLPRNPPQVATAMDLLSYSVKKIAINLHQEHRSSGRMPPAPGNVGVALNFGFFSDQRDDHHHHERALWIDPDSGQLEEHLLRRGFMLGFNEEPAANVGHEEEADIGREDEESPQHGVHHEEGEADEGDDDAGGDGGGDAESKQTPLTRDDSIVSRVPARGYTLSVTLECLEMKAEHKWTDSSFSDNMKSWHARLPKDNTLPTSIDEAKKVVFPLDLPHVKYHACINDCALFRNEYKDITTCPVCGQGRYKRGNKKVPLKVVWYFPITPRLQRYFVDPEKGKILTHPADASQWNELDIEFADEFGSEPRNIRLGHEHRRTQSLGNQSSTHSTWPVFVWPYNLPPVHKAAVNHGFKACVKCMDKTPHLQLPKAPGSCKTVFQGTRMWLRFDHPWRKHKDLFNGEEELGRAPRPRSGEEISELLENWEECPAPGKKRPRESPLLGVWKASSTGYKKRSSRYYELEIYFPPAFFDIMVHLLVHVLDDIIHLGPTFLHNMMPFERLNGVIKGFVRNRARPDGSIAKGFLTYECISFCQNYLSTENEDVGLPTGSTSAG